MANPVEVSRKQPGGKTDRAAASVVVEIEGIAARDKAERGVCPWCVLGLSKVMLVPGQYGGFEGCLDVDDLGVRVPVSVAHGWVKEFFSSGDFDLGEWLQGVIAECPLDATEALGGFELFVNDF
jgi:hypothetical protein